VDSELEWSRILEPELDHVRVSFCFFLIRSPLSWISDLTL